MSELLSRITKACFKATSEETEAISTEDMISSVDKFNTQIRQGEVDGDRVMIGSLDVEALYPSIDVNLAAKMTGNLVRESAIKFEGIDWRWALIYLVLTMSNIEKVDSVTLLRKDKLLTGGTISWTLRFQHALAVWPCLNNLG